MALIGFYNYNFPCYSTQCCLTVVSSWTISMPLILAVSADSEKKKKTKKKIRQLIRLQILTTHHLFLRTVDLVVNQSDQKPHWLLDFL